MPRRFFPLVFLLSAACALVAADMLLTNDQLVQFIQSSVKLKQPDRQVAEYLKHVKLKNKLDDRTIEELQGMGAGPKTVAALHDLRDETNSLTEAPPPPPKPVVTEAPPPDSIQQAKILADVTDYVKNYSKQLPNFICLRVTRRYVDQNGGDYWRLADTVTAKLSYFDQHEDYKVVFVNNQAVTTDTPLDKVGGTVSEGEFGTMMRDIFKPDSEARFGWDHWGTLRGKRCYVFSYDIEQARSQYHISYEHTQDYVPAYQGQIFVDIDTKMVMRVTLNPRDVPVSYPIQNVHLVLDFDFTKIGDSEFLLPLKSKVTSKVKHYASKNEDEFRMYHKYGTDTTIKFDTPDPLPEEKTKEKP